jgi:hypothetical protein
MRSIRYVLCGNARQRSRNALAASTEDAIAILERWRQQTARALGLSEHLARG